MKPRHPGWMDTGVAILAVNVTTSGVKRNPTGWAHLRGILSLKSFEVGGATRSLGHACWQPLERHRRRRLALSVCSPPRDQHRFTLTLEPTSLGFWNLEFPEDQLRHSASGAGSMLDSWTFSW